MGSERGKFCQRSAYSQSVSESVTQARPSPSLSGALSFLFKAEAAGNNRGKSNLAASGSLVRSLYCPRDRVIGEREREGLHESLESTLRKRVAKSVMTIVCKSYVHIYISIPTQIINRRWFADPELGKRIAEKLTDLQSSCLLRISFPHPL